MEGSYKEFYPDSAFLKASDLEDGKTYDATIIDTLRTEFKDGKKKIVLSLEGYEKNLVLNKTNADIMADKTKTDVWKDWTGHKITFVKNQITFEGKLKDTIRILNVVKNMS